MSSFIAALFTITMIQKQPKCSSMDDWKKKLWPIYTMKYHSAMKKNEILSFATTWVDLEGIMLSEINQTDKYYESTYIWDLKKKINEQTRQKQTHRQNKLMVSRWKKVWGELSEKGEMIKKYKFIATE